MDKSHEFEPDSIDAITGAERKVVAPRGGYYSIGRKNYWIPGNLYAEVEAKDNAMPVTNKGTKEFGKWLMAFIKEHDLEPRAIETNTRSLAGYWAMPYGVQAGERASDRTIKMASVLRASRSIASVVDPEHKCTIEYSDGMGTSAWDTGNKIFMPTEPIAKVPDLEDCINVMGGFTIHEAWHSLDSRRVLGEGGLHYLKTNQWNAWLFNLLEDERIEFNGLKETPGYAEYLNYVAEFMWSEKGLPKAWPNDPGERFQAAIALIRYPERTDEICTDESLIAPREWLRDWSKRYIAAQSDNPTSETMQSFVEEGKEFLGVRKGEPSPPSSSKMMLACAFVDGDSGSTSSERSKVTTAIEEEIEGAKAHTKEWVKIFGEPTRPSTSGANMSSVVVRRPASSGEYVPSKGSLIEKARAALTLRKVQAQHDTRMMSNGVLDEDELYRFATGDVRIFKDATVESLPSAAVTLLVDMSGSMGRVEMSGSPAYYAVGVAQMVVEAFSKNPNVKLRVLGHTGENDDNPRAGSFYRIWEPGDPLSRLSILSEGHLYSQNYDGWAIQWAGNMLKNEVADQKLLIVLADGQPCATSYGGREAMDHVREVTDKLERAGVYTVQVAVDAGLYEADQKRMFKHYIAVDSASGHGDELFGAILRKLTKVLSRVA